MAKLLVYYAHPGHRHSRLNRPLAKLARGLPGITFVDLYAEYPRHEIDVDAEQRRLVEHDVILMQFPLFWYATPSLLKEWIDLVLEHGFAYGKDGYALVGKRLMLAVSAGAPDDAYSDEGYQRHPLRRFLLPLEQTAALCHLAFTAPYTLYGSLAAAEGGRISDHADGYRRLLEAVRDDCFDFAAVADADVITHENLPIRPGQ